MRDELVALERLMEEPRELQTCHRDLWADNVLRTTAGGLCVIDWENCGLADPSQELALVLFEFGLGDSERARTLYRRISTAAGQAGSSGEATSRCSSHSWGTSERTPASGG